MQRFLQPVNEDSLEILGAQNRKMRLLDALCVLATTVPAIMVPYTASFMTFLLDYSNASSDEARSILKNILCILQNVLPKFECLEDGYSSCNQYQLRPGYLTDMMRRLADLCLKQADIVSIQIKKIISSFSSFRLLLNVYLLWQIRR